MDNRLILISQTISFLETVHAVIIVFVASDEIDLIEVEISKIFSQKKLNFSSTGQTISILGGVASLNIM